jgi:hypothetical protein
LSILHVILLAHILARINFRMLSQWVIKVSRQSSVLIYKCPTLYKNLEPTHRWRREQYVARNIGCTLSIEETAYPTITECSATRLRKPPDSRNIILSNLLQRILQTPYTLLLIYKRTFWTEFVFVWPIIIQYFKRLYLIILYHIKWRLKIYLARYFALQPKSFTFYKLSKTSLLTFFRVLHQML